MGAVKKYLILFNVLSTLGWVYVLVNVLQNYLASVPVHQYWESSGNGVVIVQSLATLEIIHSLLGIVPSPFLTTFLQVSSRLTLALLISPNSQSAQNHWSLYIMILSWSLVEVPRYLFYAASLALPKVPFPLFWIRYSLFYILYPTGISGELGQIWSALKDAKHESLLVWYMLVLLIIVYAPASPFMYYHMIGQRKRALEKLNAPSPAAPVTFNGLEFPIDPKTGQPSSTIINKGAFATSIREISPDKAKRIDSERDWRFKYDRYILDHVSLCLADPKECQKICQSGLDYLHRAFDFYRDGKRMPFAEAMRTVKETFHTGIVKGEKPLSKSPFIVPYKNKELKGKELLEQLDKWAKYGTIEAEARDSIAAVVNNEDWLDLSDQYFVLLGAGSAMGPLLVLLSLGANIIAIDLDREVIWKNLINQTKNSSGTLYFPLKKLQSELTPEQYAQNAGCNLFTQTPEIKNWLNQIAPGKPLVVGGYAYLDGALHVKVALAMDAIMAGLCDSRKNVTLAFLCTPTDVHVITEAAYKAQQYNYQNAPLWQKIIEKIPGSGLRKSQIKPVPGKGGPYKIVDGLVIQQGPNYALAKRIQHWRAVVARGNKISVSSNVAPSTSTPSVVSNKQFAAAYAEMHRFVPMEIFVKETSNAVMGALLIHDIRNPKSIANPQTETTNPLQLFQIGSFHGGIWRTGHHFGELGFYSALIFYIRQYFKPVLFVSVAFIVTFVSVIYQNGLPHTW